MQGMQSLRVVAQTRYLQRDVVHGAVFVEVQPDAADAGVVEDYEFFVGRGRGVDDCDAVGGGRGEDMGVCAGRELGDVAEEGGAVVAVGEAVGEHAVGEAQTALEGIVLRY